MFMCYFGFVKVQFQGLYDLLVIGWVSDRIRFWTTKEKFLAGKAQGNPAANPARSWPDCLGNFWIRAVGHCLQSGQESDRKSGRIVTWPALFMCGSDFSFSVWRILNHLSALISSGTFSIVYNRLNCPGESWTGSPLTPLVCLRGRWGCHT